VIVLFWKTPWNNDIHLFYNHPLNIAKKMLMDFLAAPKLEGKYFSF